MRTILKIACLSQVLILAACQPPGSYDNHGNYHSADNGYQGQKAMVTNASDDRDAVSYHFNKAGFYDAQGAYAGDNGSFGVVPEFLPPAGMCRVWTPDRPQSTQPPAEACREKYHLKSSQYVIFGG